MVAGDLGDARRVASRRRSHACAQPIWDAGPTCGRLGRARLSSITEIVAAHNRDRDPPDRAERIRDAARGWHEFWIGRLDLDDLAWEIGEICDDIDIADNANATPPPTPSARWRHHWPDDVLDVGSRCRTDLRSRRPGPGGATGSTCAPPKQPAAFVGLNPSNWESGLSAATSWSITKEGPAEMRLAYYQAANIARRRDPHSPPTTGD